jgi:hypothetical protein
MHAIEVDKRTYENPRAAILLDKRQEKNGENSCYEQYGKGKNGHCCVMTWIWSSVQKDGIYGCHFILATLRVIINAWKGYFNLLGDVCINDTILKYSCETCYNNLITRL